MSHVNCVFLFVYVYAPWAELQLKRRRVGRNRETDIVQAFEIQNNFLHIHVYIYILYIYTTIDTGLFFPKFSPLNTTLNI